MVTAPALPREQLSAFAREWGRWRDDPVRFNAVALNRPAYWSRQREICRAVCDYRTTVVYSGNAVGKSFLIAGLIPWWLYTRPGSLVLCTAPSQTSIGSILAVQSSPLPAPRISQGIKTSPAVIQIAPGWNGLGYSTTTVERASGQHAKDLLCIVDEASGVEPEIFDAIESLKYTRLLCLGNPLRAEGRFIDLIHQAAEDHAAGIHPTRAVCAIQIPSTDSPDAGREVSEYGLADRTWLEACTRRYGVDSLWVRSHIHAIIPKLTNEALIPPEHLDACTRAETKQTVAELRETGKGLGGRRRITCDVGEGCGNSRTSIWVLDDLGELDRTASRYTGPRDAAAEVSRLAAKWGIGEDGISYDGAGQTGKRLGNCLAGQGFTRARAYFGSSSGGKRCTNLRTACALALARRLDPDHYRGAGATWYPYYLAPGADWEATREELLGLRYHLAGDQSALEDKADFMDRLGRSPDHADSLCQGFRQEALEG
jgi:hypothetical protein